MNPLPLIILFLLSFVSIEAKDLFAIRATADLDSLSRAGQVMDKGGLTKAGRALDKHGNRLGSMFPKVKGGRNSKNIQDQYCLDDILTNPSTIIGTSNRPCYGG